ncbi:MAG: hypothetical protein PF495_19945, partial [Spirochaetales bacterium]|nr:hypothetical protein [Spirochaetales bacterium]
LATKEIKTSGDRIYLDDENADYMTDQTIRTLTGTNYFTIVSPDRLRPYQGYSRNSVVTNRMLAEDLGVDAVLIGIIHDMDYDERIENREVSVRDDTANNNDGGYTTAVESYFVQNVELQASYSIIDVKNGQVLASKYLSGRDSSRTRIKDADSFTAPLLEPMYRTIIRNLQSDIRRQLAPYYVREYRNLKAEKGNERFDTAKKLIQRSQYREALDLYIEMWNDTENFAAGYNAAILYEVIGQYNSALAMSKEVYDVTGNLDAYDQYKRLQRVKIEAEEAQKQF